MLPGEDRPPKGEALTGRLYFGRQPPEMRAAICLPISGADDEAPPEDDEAARCGTPEARHLPGFSLRDRLLPRHGARSAVQPLGPSRDRREPAD